MVDSICGDDSLRLQAEGFWNDSAVSSHGGSSSHTHQRDKRSKNNWCLVWPDCSTRESFYPRSFIVEPTETLFGCQRARELHSSSFCCAKKRSCNGMLFPPTSGAAFIPGVNAGAFR